jgi:hypothetical protein
MCYSKESIYDLLSNVGCDSFAGLLQSTGYMYSLGDDHKGTVRTSTDFDTLIAIRV